MIGGRSIAAVSGFLAIAVALSAAASGCGEADGEPAPADTGQSLPVEASAPSPSGEALPSGWTELELPITHVVYPEELFAAASFEPPMNTRPRSQCSPDTLLKAMPADAALVRVIEYTRVRSLDEFPPRPRRFQYSDGVFGSYECAGDSFRFVFREAGRAFQAHVNLNRGSVDRRTKAEALQVLNGLTVPQPASPNSRK